MAVAAPDFNLSAHHHEKLVAQIAFLEDRLAFGEVSGRNSGSEKMMKTAVALTDVTLAPIKENQFLFLVKNAPFFALSVMRVLASRLRRQNKLV